MDGTEGLTAEEIEARDRAAELEQLKTQDGQANVYREALMDALKAKNLEVAAQGLQPRIDSVIQALTMLQAEFVAMYPDRGTRRRVMAEIEGNLPRLVALRTGIGGQKKAKPMTPEQVN